MEQFRDSPDAGTVPGFVAARRYAASMPIYEYLCADCSGTFEELVRGEPDEVHCPDCGATTVTRLLSSFATPRPVMAGGGGGGGGCCGGSCGCGH